MWDRLAQGGLWAACPTGAALSTCSFREARIKLTAFYTPPTRSYWGELTDLGRRSTLELGARLRSLYVDQLGFLPSSLDASTLPSVAFRSTNMPRTIESLHQIVEGLWGKERRLEGVRVPFAVRGWLEEDLYPNTSCRCALFF